MRIIDGIGRTFCAHEQWKCEETTLYKSIKIIFIINSFKKIMLYNCREGYKNKQTNRKKTNQNGSHYNNFKQKSISWNIFIWGFVIKLLFSCQVMSDPFVIPMNCCLPGYSVYGISQARIPEWVAISYSKASSQPRDQTCISCISRWILYHWATSEDPCDKVDIEKNEKSISTAFRLYWQKETILVSEFVIGYGAEEDSWKSSGQQGDQTSHS